MSSFGLINEIIANANTNDISQGEPAERANLHIKLIPDNPVVEQFSTVPCYPSEH